METIGIFLSILTIFCIIGSALLIILNLIPVALMGLRYVITFFIGDNNKPDELILGKVKESIKMIALSVVILVVSWWLFTYLNYYLGGIRL